MTIEILIGTDGAARSVYADDARTLYAALGSVRIARASHVEPDADGAWWADMAPVAGPRLGPFDLRADALAAELSWLTSAGIPVPASLEDSRR